MFIESNGRLGIDLILMSTLDVFIDTAIFREQECEGTAADVAFRADYIEGGACD